MANGDEKYRSRKWRLAKASLAAVTVFAAYALVRLAGDGGDAALIMELGRRVTVRFSASTHTTT